MSELLRIEDLQICFDTFSGRFAAVDGITFSVEEKEILCLVGESGSGKSVTSLGIMRLLQSPPAIYTRGKIWYKGENLLQKKESEMRRIRGNKISMIFQEPMTSLNPVLTIGYQIMESFRAHRDISQENAWKRAEELLERVGITEPRKRMKEYPYQLSGGMRQRVMIAIALACEPELLIADEPTTALDVTIQAQILRLLKDIQKETGMTILLITHDLGVMAEMANRVVIMYAGKIMEMGNVRDIFEDPRHPYTKGLMDCIPKLDEKKEHLDTIEGMVPELGKFPAGCRFSNRCSFCQKQCFGELPKVREENGHFWACHLLPQEWRGGM